MIGRLNQDEERKTRLHDVDKSRPRRYGVTMQKTPPPKNTIEYDHKPDSIDMVGRWVYGIRWGLVPMYLGLWVAMVAYNFQFIRELFNFLVETNGPYWYLKDNTETSYLLWILGLIDITMIGNLVVMTTIGGFSTFVRQYDLSGRFRMPSWLDELDSNTLKIKMGMSLVAVTAIHLLKTFMNIHDVSWDILWKEVLIHVVFMFTTIAFTINAKFMPHKSQSHAPVRAEPPATE